MLRPPRDTDTDTLTCNTCDTDTDTLTSNTKVLRPPRGRKLLLRNTLLMPSLVDTCMGCCTEHALQQLSLRAASRVLPSRTALTRT